MFYAAGGTPGGLCLGRPKPGLPRLEEAHAFGELGLGLIPARRLEISEGPPPENPGIGFGGKIVNLLGDGNGLLNLLQGLLDPPRAEGDFGTGG